MNYKTFGEGRDIVFLHGWGGDISSFLFIAERLAGSARVTLVDFAGFGDTPEPDRPYTVADYAADVLSVMDAEEISSAAIVAHSFGGRVALELAAKHPDRVNSLALTDSAGVRPRRGLKYYLKVYTHKFLRFIGRKGLKGSSDYASLSPVMKRTFINVVNYDQTPLLKKISQPAAIFWGKDDKQTPVYMARKLKRGISNSEIFWLKGGHFAYMEDVRVYFAILSAFLRCSSQTDGGGKL